MPQDSIEQYRKIRSIMEGNTMANMALAMKVKAMRQDRGKTTRDIIRAINQRDDDEIHYQYIEEMLSSYCYDRLSFSRLSNNALKVQCVDVAALLPHGSGIDGTWSVTETSNSVRFHNSYHCMDENGMYDDWQDFTIIIPKSALGNNDAIAARFKLQFNGDRYMANKYQLRDYLEDTIAYHLTMEE